jgi:hypothetical protein
MADELTPLAPTILSERLAVTEAVVEPPLIPQVVTEVVASTIVVAEDPGANTPFGDKVFANADNADLASRLADLEKDEEEERARRAALPPSGVVVQEVNKAGVIVVDGLAKENLAPECVRTGDAPVSGEPSNTPSVALGKIDNTCIDISNKKRSHVCDFISEMQKNQALNDYTKAIGAAIRESIKKIMKLLGLTDRTGKFSYIISKLRAFAAELRRINREIIQPIIDFEKYVLAYITKLRALIQWLLSLPAALLKLLADCLARLLKLIRNVFSDIISEATSGLGGDDGEGGFSELVAAAKDAVKATGETISKVSEAAVLAAEIPIAATAGLIVPVSQAELNAANTTIQQYTSTNPAVSDITNAGQNKLAQFGFPDKNALNDQLKTLTKPAF